MAEHGKHLTPEEYQAYGEALKASIEAIPEAEWAQKAAMDAEPFTHEDVDVLREAVRMIDSEWGPGEQDRPEWARPLLAIAAKIAARLPHE